MSTASTLSGAEPCAQVADAGREARIKAQQIRVLYTSVPRSAIASIIASLVLAVGMAGATGWSVPMLWFAAVCLHQALRRIHYRRYMCTQAAAPDPLAAPRWGNLFVVSASIAGAIWGLAPYIMFVPESLGHQAVMVSIFYGICATAAAALAPYMPALIGFVSLMMAPLLVRLALVDDTTHWFMFIAGVLVLLSATVFGRNINRLVRRSIEVRYRNEDLIRALSEQKALAEAARAQAEHADRAKSQFLAAASHDLRQPLHALGLFGAALETRTRDPEAKALVTSINQSVEALETLFNELLDISRLDAGAIQPALAHFPLRPLLNRIRLDFSAPAQQKQLRFVVHDSALWVHSDALLLERMLRNFVANAVRYTHRGGVLVACRRRGSQVSVEIWDTGIGFAADQRELIFEEFYQVGDTGRHTKKGLGLGLAIARRLALLLGYRIEVRSEPRRGSVFGLRVPLGDAHAATAAPAEQPVVASPLAQGKLILVVDDETPILDGMHALLSTWGCEVVTGASGDEALDALGELERYPDLIIADYRLQRKETGIDVIRRVREELGVLLPAILITGTTTGDLASAVENIGCDLLYKPVLPQELQATIAGKLGLG